MLTKHRSGSATYLPRYWQSSRLTQNQSTRGLVIDLLCPSTVRAGDEAGALDSEEVSSPST